MEDRFWLLNSHPELGPAGSAAASPDVGIEREERFDVREGGVDGGLVDAMAGQLNLDPPMGYVLRVV